MIYEPFDATLYLCVSGMIISLVSSISLMVQLSRAAGNSSFDIQKNKKELESAFTKEKAKKYKFSYFGSWFGSVLFLIGFTVWFIERVIRLN